MNRRLFFAALAGLPFVGRLVKKPRKPPLEFSEWGGPVSPPAVPCAPPLHKTVMWSLGDGEVHGAIDGSPVKPVFRAGVYWLVKPP